LVKKRASGPDKRGYSNRDYAQDHVPVREQREIVGHAVRAMYLYAGVADVARHTGDPALFATMEAIWHDVTLRKMYITAGIGPSAHNEGFTTPYALPNETAYAETCAAIGMALWNHRMLLLHGHAKYADVLEQALYNGSISGVSHDGGKFFYVNPLASHGHHHRQPWYGCACCPTNIVRFIPQVGGYFYATTSKGVWVNLYAASQAKVTLNSQQVELIQETDYPWSGSVKLVVRPPAPVSFDVNLRLPGWCENATLRVNGQTVAAKPEDNGYLRIHRKWHPGDTIHLELQMPIQRIIAHPNVATDVGRVSLRRGPIVYCLEGVDNGGSVQDIALPRDRALEAHFEPDLLGGVTVLRGNAIRRKPIEWDGVLYQPVAPNAETSIQAIPYYAWDNRAPGEMVVWLPETTALQ